MMHYSQAALPPEVQFAGATPLLTETNIPPAMMMRHMAPKNKYGWLTVRQGHIRLVWEDTGEILDADRDHPVLIEPERYHHVLPSGPVLFRVEFYRIPDAAGQISDPEAVRPGEAYIS